MPIGPPSPLPGRCASTLRASRWSRSRPRISSGRGRVRAPRPSRRATPGRRPPWRRLPSGQLRPLPQRARQRRCVTLPRISPKEAHLAVTATLKFVLREIPASREHDGLVYLALHNVPKGVPARVHLDAAPLLVGCPSKLWRTALQRTQALAASGPPLWIVEARGGAGGRAAGGG